MAIKNKKKIAVIVLVLLVFVALIVAGVIVNNKAKNNKETNNLIKDTEEKLADINAKELEEKIIEKLKNSDLNIIKQVDNLGLMTIFGDGVNFEDYITASMVCYKEDEIIGAVEIPCFKIESDNGKFKNIEYTDFVLDENIIDEVIKEVFKEEYDIDIQILGNSKYNEYFNDIKSGEGEIYYYDDNFFLSIYSIVSGIEVEYGDAVYSPMLSYNMKTFGLDF